MNALPQWAPIDVEGYTFRVFVTNRAGDAEELRCDYNQRACVEQHIEELKNDLQADGFCMRDFFATECAILGTKSRKPVLHIAGGWGGLSNYKPLIDNILRWQIFTLPKLPPEPPGDGQTSDHPEQKHRAA